MKIQQVVAAHGRQYIVVSISGGNYSGELLAKWPANVVVLGYGMNENQVGGRVGVQFAW